jgi:hypothetical protein
VTELGSGESATEDLERNDEMSGDDLTNDAFVRIKGRKSYAGKTSSLDVKMPYSATYKTVHDKLIRDTPHNL